MSSGTRRVLVVEDEAPIRDLVCLHLQLAGYECLPIETGPQALELARTQPFDLIVLDLMLPGLDGVTICRALRREGANRDAAILMLTARSDEADKVLGLESGADDYLTKPFSVREMVARADALTRRARAPIVAGRPLQIRGLELDPARRRVVARGREVDLTKQEFALVYLLASHPGIVFSREALLAKVWQGEAFVTDRSVDTLIKRVRRKIEPDPANPELILTVWGSGYKFVEA